MSHLATLLKTPYLLVLVLMTIGWFVGSTYWYVCETHNLCQSHPAPAAADTTTVALESAEQPPTEEAESTAVEPYQFEPNDQMVDEVEVTPEPPETEVHAQVDDSDESGFVLQNSNQIDTAQTITALFNPDAISFREITWEDDIQAIATYLENNPQASVRIEGYAAQAASSTNEQQLSLARANALKEYMMVWGAPSGQVQTVGRAYADPVGDNATDAGRALNRRAVLSFID